jgi:hypothetical protein
MERFRVTITGVQPLLHHQDSIEWGGSDGRMAGGQRQ